MHLHRKEGLLKRLKRFLAVLPAVLCLGAAPVPEGWQALERIESPAVFFKEDPRRFTKISEDFNADGIRDEAMVLVNKSKRAAAVYAFVSQGHGYKTCILDTLEETWWLDAVGIRVAAPGTYDTTCGRLYFDCDSGEPGQFTLKLPGILYSKEGRESCLFYWSEEQKRFKRIWVMD